MYCTIVLGYVKIIGWNMFTLLELITEKCVANKNLPMDSSVNQLFVHMSLTDLLSIPWHGPIEKNWLYILNVLIIYTRYYRIFRI